MTRHNVQPRSVAEVPRVVAGENSAALTATFTVFVLFQLANVFNARSEDRSVFSRASLTNRSLWLDLSILVRTVRIVLTSQGV